MGAGWDGVGQRFKSYQIRNMVEAKKVVLCELKTSISI